MAGATVFIVVVLGIIFPIVLYLLVRAEHTKRERMDRQEAEQAARRDTRDRE